MDDPERQSPLLFLEWQVAIDQLALTRGDGLTAGLVRLTRGPGGAPARHVGAREV